MMPAISGFVPSDYALEREPCSAGTDLLSTLRFSVLPLIDRIAQFAFGRGVENHTSSGDKPDSAGPKHLSE
jgi:hypothetical protein